MVSKKKTFKKIKSLTFRKKGITRQSLAREQALYIFNRFCEVTNNPEDRTAKPVLLRLVSLLHNPGYYKHPDMFYKLVVHELIDILKEKGVVSKEVSTKHSCFKDHPLFCGYEFFYYLEDFCDKYYSRYGSRTTRRLPGFSGVIIHWPFTN